ncbi:MAG: ERCC4 domain-containing protein [Candidatus Thorarchaeota archaeon]|jgi:ERCC4-type nuclease
MGTIRKPRKPPTKFKIIRDTREQKGKGWLFRASANCDGVEITKLDVGDYTVKGLEDVLAIERKTLGDLWNTLGRHENYARFLKEWDRAKNHKLKFLIIEATLSDVDRGYRYSKVPVNNIHAKLVSLQVKHNVHVIFAGRLDLARGYARRLMDKVFRYHEKGIV